MSLIPGRVSDIVVERRRAEEALRGNGRLPLALASRSYSNGLSYSLRTGMMVAGYLFIVFLVATALRLVVGYGVLVPSLAAAAVTTVAVQPLRHGVAAWVDRLFFREPYDAGLMLQRVSRTAASYLDLEGLTNRILDEVTTTMRVERAAFLIRRNGEFPLVAQRGLDRNVDLTLRNDHPIPEWLSSHESALTRRDVETTAQFNASPSEESGDWERAGMEVFIPLKAKGELVGIFALGPRLWQDTYSRGDLLALTALGDQTAIAIENVRLYEQARRDAEVKSALLREVNHRVRNNLAATLGLLYRAESQASVEERAVLQPIMSDVISGIRGLAAVNGQLSRSEGRALLVSEVVSCVMRSTLETVSGDKRVSIDVNPSSVRVTPEQAHSLALAINELATYTVRSALRECDAAHITVRIELDEDTVVLEFRDDGPGHPEEALRAEGSSVSVDRIRNIVRRNLRGELSLHNHDGGVAVIRFKAKACGKRL